MKIRSITYFFDPGWPLKDDQLRQASAFLGQARPIFVELGYDVQTCRLATTPFGQWSTHAAAAGIPRIAQALEAAAAEMGFDYISLGPAQPDELSTYAAIPEALAATQRVFFSGQMTTGGGGVSLPAVQACASVIQQSAGISPDGFANLRFAALANVPPGSPFFPAAYHSGSQPAFALALEAADLAVQAFSGASSLAQARQNLIQQMDGHAQALSAAAGRLSLAAGLPFGGIDFSLAPFPEEALSLGTAFERLGVPAVGLPGSLAAAAFLADCMDRAAFRRAGFSGLMLPVLEDATLARRAADGSLTVKDLLLFSAVCGTGLDTVPLPGDTQAGELAAILLDLAALAQRLDKPLTARLMPIPGKQAGEPTGFDFAFFANSRVMATGAQALSGALASDETFKLQPRRR